MRKNTAILIVEPDKPLAAKLASAFRSRGGLVQTVHTFQEACNSIEQDSPELVLCATHLEKGSDGIAVLNQIQQKAPSVPVILISSTADIDACKEAIKQGAYDYLVKPLDVDELVRMADAAIPSSVLIKGTEDFVFSGIVSRSPSMQTVYRVLRRISATDMPILIEGESGTGKELTAKAVHTNSSRKDRPFYPINCAGLAESLLESELFGHVKGSFTGATADRKGLFQLADKGTLFLDEIGDMPLALQAKLLRVLQEGEVRPLGSNHSHRVDVRIIAATHQNLFDQVEQGRFREDLYYRLSHFPIALPPLRERGADIRQLALHFTRETCAFLQRSDCRWSDSALAYLASHRFPGNVRELKGLIARALLLCDGNVLLPEHLQLPNTPTHAHRLTLREQLDKVERNLLSEALQQHNGNQTLTAQVLGLPRRTLLYRMQRLGLPPRPQRQTESAPK